jgi:Ni/Fe-hydrogenase subunit HybB-like protein
MDGSRKLWISDLRSPDFIAPADESALGLLTRQGITYQTYLDARISRLRLRQSTSALGILVLAAAAGSVLRWVMKRTPLAMSRV